jgi:hypothetical protein
MGQGFTVILAAHGGRVLSMGVRKKFLRARRWGLLWFRACRQLRGYVSAADGLWIFVHFSEKQVYKRT